VSAEADATMRRHRLDLGFQWQKGHASSWAGDMLEHASTPEAEPRARLFGAASA
jgi:hypothetical protein